MKYIAQRNLMSHQRLKSQHGKKKMTQVTLTLSNTAVSKA